MHSRNIFNKCFNIETRYACVGAPANALDTVTDGSVTAAFIDSCLSLVFEFPFLYYCRAFVVYVYASTVYYIYYMVHH